jgi:hypothetical protein
VPSFSSRGNKKPRQPHSSQKASGSSTTKKHTLDRGECQRSRDELPARADELSYGQTALYLDAEEAATRSADLMRVLAPYLEQSSGKPNRG